MTENGARYGSAVRLIALDGDPLPTSSCSPPMAGSWSDAEDFDCIVEAGDGAMSRWPKIGVGISLSLYDRRRHVAGSIPWRLSLS